jgi:hypothetical protein
MVAKHYFGKYKLDCPDLQRELEKRAVFVPARGLGKGPNVEIIVAWNNKHPSRQDSLTQERRNARSEIGHHHP